jgi:solute carrier family 31 (copper transporter), member 1
MFSSSHLAQTFMHVLQVTVSYFLMLAVMTYNWWLCGSVLLGAGAGYFVFGKYRSSVTELNEHCN